jgi:hypothetical protein
MITSWIKIVRFPTSSDSRTTNMPDAAQAQEAPVLSLKFSGFVVPSGTKSGPTEASSGLEDARRLLDISTSSNSEDMRGGDTVQLALTRTVFIHLVLRVMSWQSGHTTQISLASHETDTNVANTKKRRCSRTTKLNM